MKVPAFILFGLPIIAGLAVHPLPSKYRKITSALCVLLLVLILITALKLFLERGDIGTNFKVDNLNAFILLFLSFFSLIVAIYSSSCFGEEINKFFSYLFLTLGAANIAVLTCNLVYLLVSWGFLGITLYLFINLSSPESAFSAKKTFIIVGGADAFLLLGIGILWKLTGSFNFVEVSEKIKDLPPQVSPFINVSILCFIIAAFAKAGAFPLHTWIPEISETTSISTLAYLPSSLDKLLGIYLLGRVVLDIFKDQLGSWVGILLTALGAFTVISAVMMALVQHNVRKLLAYHAVSQVGYMVLGIGTLNPIGFIGGLFHMLNNAIYKSCLFLSAGNVEGETKSLELDKLGGIAKYMPFTFICMLIASLSISGVPPFNGFYSKWMIYQGLISQFTTTAMIRTLMYSICLVAIMFGSALTLASFLKLLFGIFLGQKGEALAGKEMEEAGLSKLIPIISLAFLCVLFGVGAKPLVLRYLINPVKVEEIGVWSPGLATYLIIVGLLAGLVVFLASRKKIRYSESFIGGETLGNEVRPLATDFYNTVKEISLLSKIYNFAERKAFDLYENCLKIAFVFIRFLRYLHNGVLPTYLVWCLIGMLILFLKFVK